MRGLALLVAALASGCGGGTTNPSGGRAADLEIGLRAVNRATGSTVAFAAPGVVVTNQPEDVVASAIVQRVRSETSNCAKATSNGSSFDADFGAGCAVASAGASFSGTVHGVVVRTVQMTPTQTTHTVTLTLTLALTVDGQMLSGTITPVTTDGNVFTYHADVMLAGVHAQTPSFSAGIAGQGATVDAIGGTLTGPAGSFAWDLSTVREGFADCYPSGGDVALTTPSGKETYSFTTATAQSGAASLTPPGGVAAPLTLPARPGCPR